MRSVSIYKSRWRTSGGFFTALLLACLNPKLVTKQVPFCAPGLCSGFPRLTYPSSSQRISPSDASRFKVLRTVVTLHKCLTNQSGIMHRPQGNHDFTGVTNLVLSVLKRNSAPELHLLAEKCPKAKLLLISHPDRRNRVVDKGMAVVNWCVRKAYWN